MANREVTVVCPCCRQDHTYSRGVGATVRCQTGDGSFRLTQRLIDEYKPTGVAEAVVESEAVRA
ncbi:MAG: hypothetical protein WC757_04535 [Candidatus Paceibacterota bacterium]|jgi:hypothetical protein